MRGRDREGAARVGRGRVGAAVKARPGCRRPAGVAAILAASALACGADDGTGPGEPATLEWVELGLDDGSALNIAVLRPGGAVSGVVLAFPWGAGDASLVLGLIDAYWDVAAPADGYAVVGVEAYGPGLEDTAGPVMAAVLGWIDANVAEGADNIVMTGASAGGVGVFHAALAAPERVGGIIAMPGRYAGGAPLAPLAGLPVWMMVGEHDANWVDRSQATAEQLEAAGAEVEHEVLPNQGHVLIVAQDALMAWIDGR